MTALWHESQTVPVSIFPVPICRTLSYAGPEPIIVELGMREYPVYLQDYDGKKLCLPFQGIKSH